MIRLLDRDGDMEALRALCGDTAFGCPILSAAEGYGLNFPGFQFWTDETAAYARVGDALRIAGTVKNAEETRHFIGAIGVCAVTGSAENLAALGLLPQKSGVVLQKNAAGTAFAAQPAAPRTVARVLCQTGLVDGETDFYVDLSHRVRHGTAFCCASEINGEMVAASCALLGGAVLLSGIGVLSAYRGQGIGRALLRRMERHFAGQRIFVLRAENQNEHFYASAGYTVCGAWGTAEIKK